MSAIAASRERASSTTTRSLWLVAGPPRSRTCACAAARTISSRPNARSARGSWRRSERALRPQPPREPRVHFLVPEQRVAGLEHPVVLVGEIDQPRGHALGLEYAVDQEPLT